MIRKGVLVGGGMGMVHVGRTSGPKLFTIQKSQTL